MLTWKEIKKNPKKLMRSLGKQSSTPDWLGPALGFFAAGLAIGAGLGLLLAPKSGTDLRNDLKQRLSDGAALGEKNSETVAAAR